LEDQKTSILKILKKAEGDAVSGEHIGTVLKISRTMVWKHIKLLQKQGYPICSKPKLGYSLEYTPDNLYAENLLSELETEILGKKILYYKETNSTNDVAKKIANIEKEGTVIVSETQKKGRGRMGKVWYSDLGGMWLSVILKPRTSIVNSSRITLISGIAVARTIRSFGLDASIKWPNDILINGKKVCGILTEIGAELDQLEFVVVGIGINVNNDIQDLGDEELRKNSTTLKKELGYPIKKIDLFRVLLNNLDQYYIKFKSQPFQSILQEWTELSDTIGKEVSISAPNMSIVGKAINITERGSLVVQTKDSGTQEVIAGRCNYETKQRK